MSDSRRKLVITNYDLRDPAIDRAIRAERELRPAAPSAPEPQKRSRLLYANWFYLMLAGALGALLAWGLIEPRFTDNLELTGNVSKVDPEGAPEDWYLEKATLRGHLVVAGVDVWTVEGVTKVFDENGTELPRGVRELTTADTITVQGLIGFDEKSMVGVFVQRTAPIVSNTKVNLQELQLSTIFWTLVLIPLVAAFVGLFIGAAEGIVCRTFMRALWSGAVGFGTGLVGGFIGIVIAGMIYEALGTLFNVDDLELSAWVFVLQMSRRGLAWAIAGIAMGLGQGIALKSGRLLLNGIIGGLVGGLMGGLLFDPLNLLIAGKELMGGAEASRGLGLMIIGAAVGVMIGITDMLTRDAWLRVLSGPLRGKEFSFSKTPIRIGSSPKNEIYLFKDERIEPVHAEVQALRDAYELVDKGSATGTIVNGSRIERHRLADGDTIVIGGTQFSFSTRERKRLG